MTLSEVSVPSPAFISATKAFTSIQLNFTSTEPFLLSSSSISEVQLAKISVEKMAAAASTYLNLLNFPFIR